MITASGYVKECISNIMAHTPIKAGMEETMHEVADLLHRHRLSSVPVVDPQTQECFGIISLKDIHKLNAQKTNLQTIHAWEACTYKPIIVTPDTPIEDVARLMVENRIHHVIVAEDRKLKGFVSSLDIIAAMLGGSLH